MDELVLVRDMAVVWMAALLVGLICARIRVPIIAGYILAGVLIGPFGLKLIAAEEQINVLAELGVALLLFALGVEISLKKMFTDAKRVVSAASIQIIGTVVVSAALAAVFGLITTVPQALILGFVCALSSTAVVTKVIVDQAETETTHGRLLVPMLLIQDLALVPVVALIPALQQSSGGAVMPIVFAVSKAAVLIIAVFIGSTLLVPRVLSWVARVNSRELFLLTVISLCLGVAFLSKELGVSLALGAFLSGIMVSERPFGPQVLAEIVPLRDLFATLFFVSVGLLLNPHFLVTHWVQVLSFVALLLVVKFLIAGAGAFVATRTAWSAALVGIAMAQMGEFSFVLATLGRETQILPEDLYNLLFASAVLTLLISPALIGMAPRLLARLPFFRLPATHTHGESAVSAEHEEHLQDHVVLCGFGRMGRSIGLALQAYGVPFVVIESNAHLAEELDRMKIPYIYGDAFSNLVLSKSNIHKAKCLVITVPDRIVAMNIMAYSRAHNAELDIVVRAVSSADVELFRAVGANSVVQPEFEASIEATRLVLIGLGKPGLEILSAIRQIRRRGYMLFRPELANDSFVELEHGDYFGQWFRYMADGSPTIVELDVRRNSGATILAVKRNEELIAHPGSETRLHHGDELYVSGNVIQLAQFEESFRVERFIPIKEEDSEDSPDFSVGKWTA